MNSITTSTELKLFKNDLLSMIINKLIAMSTNKNCGTK